MVDVTGGGFDCVERVAEIGRKRRIIKSRCEVVDDADNSAIVCKTCFYFAAEYWEAVDLLFEMGIREIAIRICVIGRNL